MTPVKSQKGNILVVDDVPANLKVLITMLTEQGYQARPAINGQVALTAIQGVPPDLILLDISMPDMDGYEVCRRLKADPNAHIRHIPIIFISARGDVEDKVKAFTMGGVDYVTKPFQVEEVLARVETHLALRALQKRLQATNHELVGANTELQARNQELDAFAHTVAHDLKGPFSHMIGFAELLVESKDALSEEDLCDALQTIAASGRKMTNIIDELLLLSSVHKVTDVAITPLNMANIVDLACQRLAYMIDEYQTEIMLPAIDAWPTALGYAPWVEEAWVNFMSNAIKYGGRPSHVEFGFDESPVRFWIRDNGHGLTPEEQERLFTPFMRLDQIRAKGHGLGLSIVRRIVEKLGGEAGVESIIGQGSKFYFTLPNAG
ncbi:MAG: hybrid sensor histidine kinase/response regulator [Candidatus Scalindua sp.]|nr:hybrid sensor histidine kinase/response regulator [Candidatus Scalindua sp.]